MKSLIYSLVLLSIFFLIASCNKDEALKPITNPGGPQLACDSTQSVNYQLTNSTGIATYEIAFSGQKNYTFNFPANGTTIISVKPGTYDVFIYSPGDYQVNSISLNNLNPTKEAGARYDGVVISPCNSAQSAVITQ
jgi:hypothetical protein